MLFVLNEWLDAPREWARLPALADVDADTATQVLQEAARFAVTSVAPLNGPGDLEGCHYEAGRVRAPAGFREAYQAYVEGGWPALACTPETGGQGLPQVLNFALFEMLTAANHGWTMYAGLAHGAYDCILAHASEPLKSRYLPKIVSGEWLATMCLTEAHAGSDLSLLRTRAERGVDVDGSECYWISGNKIFISGGAQDLTDNIVHLVLARLPDSPPGNKGLSLFLVPQQLPGGNDSRENAVYCDGIEHKMGIKGSATCSMRFERAVGWLIGAPNRGLASMFAMMNSARLHVAIQGLGHAEAACQSAIAYANERRQMRTVGRQPQDGQAADLIVGHPPVRRALLEMRAIVQGERALAYWAAQLLDLSAHLPEKSDREACHELCSLLTPALKSLCTDNGFRLANTALQVYGGHGYLRDHGIEQRVRDSRIAMIYEGTNEIQAVDLLVRKVLAPGARGMALLLENVFGEMNLCRADPRTHLYANVLERLHSAITESVAAIRNAAAADAEAPYRAADDFTRAFGLLLLAFAWARSARIAGAHPGDQAPYRDIVSAARFGVDFVVPEFDHRLQLVRIALQGVPNVD
jgi:alkylation response protein AidB-like acyl-CoA dehydrogenase